MDIIPEDSFMLPHRLCEWLFKCPLLNYRTNVYTVLFWDPIPGVVAKNSTSGPRTGSFQIMCIKRSFDYSSTTVRRNWRDAHNSITKRGALGPIRIPKTGTKNNKNQKTTVNYELNRKPHIQPWNLKKNMLECIGKTESYISPHQIRKTASILAENQKPTAKHRKPQKLPKPKNRSYLTQNPNAPLYKVNSCATVWFDF